MAGLEGFVSELVKAAAACNSVYFVLYSIHREFTKGGLVKGCLAIIIC